jgi:hypothetical protein
MCTIYNDVSAYKLLISDNVKQLKSSTIYKWNWNNNVLVDDGFLKRKLWFQLV